MENRDFKKKIEEYDLDVEVTDFQSACNDLIKQSNEELLKEIQNNEELDTLDKQLDWISQKLIDLEKNK